MTTRRVNREYVFRMNFIKFMTGPAFNVIEEVELSIFVFILG